MASAWLSIHDLPAKQRTQIGNKAARLAHLAATGFPILEGWVLPFASYRDGAARDPSIHGFTGRPLEAMDNTTRKPTLLLKLSGSFLLRAAQRAVLAATPPANRPVGHRGSPLARGRSLSSRGPLLLPPSAEQPADLVDLTSDVPVPAVAEQAEVAAQAQVETQLGQGDVGARERSARC